MIDCKKCKHWETLNNEPFCGHHRSYLTTEQQICSNYERKEEESKTCIEIGKVLESMKHLLKEKNKRYGDSALTPVGVFNKLDATSSIQVRLDDKISRIQNSNELRKNDVADVIGYLTLLCVAKGWTNFDELID